MKLVVLRRLVTVLKRLYPNLVEIPVCALGIRWAYYSDESLTVPVGEALYLLPEMDENLQISAWKKVKYRYSTDYLVRWSKT